MTVWDALREILLGHNLRRILARDLLSFPLLLLLPFVTYR
jgi:hypothetical protein